MKQRGYTLVELMVVVAMIGVLAALAMVGYRKHMYAAQASEASTMISAIRAGEENQRAETLGYLQCSSKLDEYYPHAAPDQSKWNWNNPAHPKFGCWHQLGAKSSAPVRFVYAVVTGLPGETPPPVPGLASQPTWPVPTEPWYVVHATADLDGDGERSSYVASSFTMTSDIYSENGEE